jgi:hypothetical protein
MVSCAALTTKGISRIREISRIGHSIGLSTSAVHLLDGTSGEAADKAIEKKIVRDRNRDARDQRSCH